jgi:hypothetical protein
MKLEFEWRECVLCEAKYIEDCKHIDVAIGGKPELPKSCWRIESIKNIPRPHDKSSNQ